MDKIQNKTQYKTLEEIYAQTLKEVANDEHKSLEELKAERIICNSEGRPPNYLTNELWQREFKLRKRFLEKYPSKIKKMKVVSIEKTNSDNEPQSIFYGNTQYQYYCMFINDILKNIRNGGRDFCYFMYQVLELAKFDYGNMELATQYNNDGYWVVWLTDKEGE